MTNFIDKNLDKILEALENINRKDLIEVLLNSSEEEQEKMVTMMLEGINKGFFSSNKTNIDELSEIMLNGTEGLDNLSYLGDAFAIDPDTGESSLQVNIIDLKKDYKYANRNMEREAEKDLFIKTGKTTADIAIEKWGKDNNIDINSFKSAAQKKGIDIKKIENKEAFLTLAKLLKI